MVEFCTHFFNQFQFLSKIAIEQGFPKWAMTDIQGATSSKGARGGAIGCKGATGGP